MTTEHVYTSDINVSLYYVHWCVQTDCSIDVQSQLVTRQFNVRIVYFYNTSRRARQRTVAPTAPVFSLIVAVLYTIIRSQLTLCYAFYTTQLTNEERCAACTRRAQLY